MYRLTNLTHSEIAPSLPLPSLPICFGASNHDLEYAKEGMQATDTSPRISHARKIAELLSSTDISYLSVRDGFDNNSVSIKTNGNLFAAVLQHDPKAFDFNKESEESNKQGRRNFNADKKIVPGLREQTPGENAQKNVSNISYHEDLGYSSPSMRRPKIKRKDHLNGKESVHSVQGSKHDAVLRRICDVMEGIFEKLDVFEEDEGDEGGALLSLSEIKLLVEEIATAHANNVVHLVPVDQLVKTMNLLDHHVKCAIGKCVDDDDESDSEAFIVISIALEAVQASLTIMTHPGMPKQVYKEEAIDRIVEFTRYQLVYSIFSAYDPVYKRLHKGVEVEDDELDNEETEAKKKRRKSKIQKGRRYSVNSVSSAVSGVLQKLCIILGLMKDLLSSQRLMDSSILQLIKTVLTTFNVENIQLLQLKAVGVTCMIFSNYPQHRIVIQDEILSLLWKIPSSKRNVRTYHLLGDESKQIQMLTALILQLVQCSVSLPDEVQEKPVTVMNIDADDGSTATFRSMDPAMDTSTYFWRNVLQRWTMPKAHEGSDIRVLVENLVTDLLTTLNAPEFPASNLLLQVLCVLLFGSAGLKSKDAVVRASAIELLGQVAARLQHDAIACNSDALWVLREVENLENVKHNSLKESCLVCGGGRDSRLSVACDSCFHMFHEDCAGVTGHNFVGRGWLCQHCYCRKQLTLLETSLKEKAADGKLSYKSKGILQSRRPEDIIVPKTGDVILQQMLLNYLDESSGGDNLAVSARRFHLWQWYRDDSEGEQNLPFYHGRWVGQASYGGARGAMPTQFTRDVIVRISALLCQLRPLARGFDRILERLLVSLKDNSPTPRAKALRAVSAIVEVDPRVLGDERVQGAVEGRFLDSAISVREAAMELVGRHISSHPDVALRYFEKIAERVMDTGVSVRKRVIKIMRDLCISRCDFVKRTEALVRILTRINDEETSIQDLVCRTFYELWFEEPGNQFISQDGDGTCIPSEISERVQQLVNVLKCLQNPQAMVIVIKRSLALDFIPQTAKNTAASLVSQATVRNRCELMCKCLIEDILKAEEGNVEDAETRALPYVLALHSFCMVDPTLCAPAADPSRYAVTLQTYLKTQIDNRDVAQLLQSIVFVIDAVLPLLRRPSLNFVEELERDLRQLIVRYSFLTVVHACIKCLCTLGKVATRGLSSFEFLVQKFFRLLDGWRRNKFGAADKPNVLRCLFCLGLLARYGANMIDSMKDNATSMEQLLSLFKYYLLSDDFDVKARSVQALGFFVIARPESMLERDTGKMIEETLSASADSRIKIQTLRNFQDYLADVEEKMGDADALKSESMNKQESGVVPVAAGAGDSNICGGIIQLHWDHILERCLDMNDQVRHAAVKVVEIVLRQGLVHPITCVPQLIALEVDRQEANAKIAHRLLSQMNEKYPSFFESRLGDGLQLSFRFLQSGAASSARSQVTAKAPVNLQSKLDITLSLSAKEGISRAYKLIRGSRISRNKFISSVVRKFDIATWGHSSLPFLVYCTEILASLPFSLPDEPLYLVYAINRLVQVRAGSIEANIKTLISEGPLGVVAKEAIETLAAQREQENENAYNLDTVKPQKTEVLVDDTDGIPEVAVSRLRVECIAAVALALLLRLKRHVKIMFNLNDARCQAFSPTETIKAGEVLSKQNVKEFSLREIPTNSSKTIKQMLEQFQVFKRLLKEDSMDYSTHISASSKKRNRSSLPSGEEEHAEDLEDTPQHHMPRLRSFSRKSSGSFRMQNVHAEENEASDDYNDEDFCENAESEHDENYPAKVRRHTRRSSNLVQKQQVY